MVDGSKRLFRSLLTAGLVSMFVGIALGQSTVVVGTGEARWNLDPQRHTSVAQWSELRNVFDPLVSWSSDMELVPSLATSWEVSDDGREWTLQLREGVHFHNGEPFNADAVKYTFERLFDEATGSPQQFLFSAVESVEVVGPYEVTISTSVPFGALLANLTLLDMLPPGAARNLDAFGRHPIGTGPFEFVSSRGDAEVVLRANEAYWDGAPLIDSLEIRTLVEGSTRLSALLAGDVHIINGVSPDDVGRLENDDRFSVVVSPTLETVFMGLNNAEGPFADSRVRLAANHAVDKAAIVEHIMLGQADTATGFVSPVAFGSSPSDGADVYEYDPELARELLAEAGYPDGFNARLIMLAGSGTKGLESTQAVVGYLEAVGIQVQVDVLEIGTFVDVRRGTDWDLFRGGSTILSGDAQFDLTRMFHSEHSGAMVKYANPEYDRLVDIGNQAFEASDRLTAYEQAQELLVEDAPWLLLYHAREVTAYVDRLEGFRARPDKFTLFHQVHLR